MRTLKESLLDKDFDVKFPEEIGKFKREIEKLAPKKDGEDCLSYWLGARRPITTILEHIGEEQHEVTNNTLLYMIEVICGAPKYVPWLDTENDYEEYPDLQYDQNRDLVKYCIKPYYDDIKKGDFKPWASVKSSGSLLYTIYDSLYDNQSYDLEGYMDYDSHNIDMYEKKINQLMNPIFKELGIK